MVNFPGRHDRRRRVLKDDLLSGSAARTAHRVAPASDAEDAPRYSDAAGVENHPQVTDFVPRRYGTIAMLIFFGAVLTAASAAAHYFMLPILASQGMDTAVFDLGARGRVGLWKEGG